MSAPTRRSLFPLALSGALALTGATRVQAQEARPGRTMLLMVDERGCPYCLKWEREVQAGYQASQQGKVLPLLRRPRGHPDLAAFDGLIYTPTFLVVVRGSEQGRIFGYAGADFFWAEIDRHVRRLGLL